MAINMLLVIRGSAQHALTRGMLDIMKGHTDHIERLNSTAIGLIEGVTRLAAAMSVVAEAAGKAGEEEGRNDRPKNFLGL